MKLWKKTSLLLCACFAFSSVATSCDLFGGDEDSSSNNSSSSTQAPSSGEGDSSSIGDIEIDDEDVIDVYMGMIAMKLKETQSAKMTFELGTTTTASGTDGVGTVGGWTNYTLKGKGVVSKREEGYNAKLEVQVPSEENAGQPEAKTYYYVDGYVYEYDADTEVYTRSYETLEETLGNLVNAASQGAYTLETLTASLVGGSGILGEDVELSLAGLQESVGDYAVIESELTDTGMKLSADAKEKTGELFRFLKEVDKETTYEEFLDFSLSQIDSELDTDAVLDAIYNRHNQTVNKVVEELDAKSVELTEKTLQENLDKLLSDETVSEMIKTMLGEEMASVILNFEIEKFLEQESTIEEDGVYKKYGEITMDEAVGALAGELADVLVKAGINLEEIGFDPTRADVSMLIFSIRYLLGEPALSNLKEGDVLYELLETAKTIEVTKTDMQFELKANEDALESVSLIGAFGGNATDGGLSASVGATADILISEFSEERVTIAIPENATIVIKYNKCSECKEEKEDVSYREEHFNYYCEECYAELSQVTE